MTGPLDPVNAKRYVVARISEDNESIEIGEVLTLDGLAEALWVIYPQVDGGLYVVDGDEWAVLTPAPTDITAHVDSLLRVIKGGAHE